MSSTKSNTRGKTRNILFGVTFTAIIAAFVLLPITAVYAQIDWTALLDPALAAIAQFFLTIGIALAAGAAIILDVALAFTLDTDNFRISAVQNGWIIFRDLANMVFIFILVYIAFATILQLSNFNTKRTLATLIVVALLLNFSFFLTGIVIDISNILGGFLYNGMTTDGQITLGTTFEVNFRLPILLEGGSGDAQPSSVAIHSFMVAIFWVMSAFAYIAAAILFVIRTVALFFILILSPIAFAAAILPQTAWLWNQWLDRLIRYSFVVPIFLLLIYAVLAIADSTALLQLVASDEEGAGFVRQRISQAAINEGYTIGRIGVILNFAILFGLLIGSVIMSQKFASDIGRMSGRLSGGIRRFATGLAYTQTFGRFFANLDERLARTPGFRGGAGYALRTMTTKPLAEAKFGARESYTKREENRLKDIEKAINNFKRSKDMPKLATYMSSLKEADQRHAYGKLSARDRAAVDAYMPPNVRDYVRSTLSTDELEKTEKEEREAKGRERRRKRRRAVESLLGQPHSIGNFGQLANEVEAMGNKEVKDLPDELLTHQRVASHFTPAQLAELIKGDNTTPQQRALIKDAIINHGGSPESIDYIQTGAGRSLWA